MPSVFPFRAVTFANRDDLSNLVAPPYDVLDAAGKQRLLAKDPANIVAIDLPHTPAKELGPPSAYQAAADAYRALLANGTLARLTSPAMFAYRQSFKNASGALVQRSGMCCTVETVPFGPRPGGGILPHEETFSGPKEDRMALMKATKTQLSPIFGLHADDHGLATALLHKVMAAKRPNLHASTDDGTLHEVWTLDANADAHAVRAYLDALKGEDVFIADGHHRYTTGLNYLKSLEAAGPVPAHHPARRCMIVLVGMSDPGLVIWPTHRVLGGMKRYSFDAFAAAAKGILDIAQTSTPLHALERDMERLAAQCREKNLPDNVLGLYDFASKRCALATLASPDPLQSRFPDKPSAWRNLDVALIQYAVVERICQGSPDAGLNAGEPVKWAFPHTIAEVFDIGSGAETGAGGGKTFGPAGAQLAIIVRPTPLQAVRDVSRANQLMPQKSTFFYPKLATGLFLNPLD